VAVAGTEGAAGMAAAGTEAVVGMAVAAGMVAIIN
jgi:hypothetical protein